MMSSLGLILWVWVGGGFIWMQGAAESAPPEQ
jgi:hypothetical protein